MSEAITKQEISIDEAAAIAADDGIFFSSFFFPQTTKVGHPEYAPTIWNKLESGSRYCALEVFRDGAKTSFLRLFTAKRISFGISRTIVFVGKGQDHAIKSVRWLKRQIDHNKRWTRAFGLEKGDKWTDEWIQIRHSGFRDEYGDPITINVVAYGMTGQIRGINIDDFRPDLIVCDDPCDEENTATPEQRKKIADLFFGALKQCLVPETENPTALMALLQTCLHKEDLISSCHKDAEWNSVKIPCFDDNGESVWPERWPTEILIREKQGYVARNQLSIWLREKECKVTAPETSAFRSEWVQFYDTMPDDPMTVVMAIDPVPPPTDNEIEKGLDKRDFEVISVVGYCKGKFYLLAYVMNRGHSPKWTAANFFTLAHKYKPMKVAVETTNYQATLKWYLEEQMRALRQYYIVEGFDEKMKKYHLIFQAFSEIATEKNFLIRREHTEFMEEFEEYPHGAYDDILNSVSLAMRKLREMGDVFSGLASLEEEKNIEPLPNFRYAP